mgnify:CR=1 FL=1
MTYYAILYTPGLLIVNLGLGSQSDPILIFGFLLNQVVNWLVIIGAAIVVRNAYKKSVWPVVIIVGVFFTKILEIVFDGHPATYLSYKFFLLVLFLVFGVIYIYKYLDLLYKHVLIICLFNVIMMVFQILNLGDWTQFLSTESTFTYGEKLTYDMLFVPLDQLQFSVIQARPSGFLRSNNILSGVLLFALALHYSRGENRLKWGTLVLSSMIILASAKIVYVGFILMGILLLLKGDRRNRKFLFKSILLLVLLLIIYSFLFPGLFYRYWTSEALFYNISIRINNIISAMDSDSIFRAQLEGYFHYAPRASWETETTVLSGYTLLVNYMRYIIIIFLMMLPLYLKGVRRLNNNYPNLTWVTILCMLVFVIYPAAVPIFKDQFYWMVGGFALAPLFKRPPDY